MADSTQKVQIQQREEAEPFLSGLTMLSSIQTDDVPSPFQYFLTRTNVLHAGDLWSTGREGSQGRRDDLAAKSSHCSCRGPTPGGSSQSPVTPVPVGPQPLLGSVGTCIPVVHTDSQRPIHYIQITL